MSPPKSPHPLAELRTPPDEYTPCDVPNYLGSNFTGHASFSHRNNKFYWVVYLGRNQGMYSLKATALAHLDGYSRERAMECHSTYDEVTAGWKKHCFHHHGHCSFHSLACAKSPCTRHAAPRCVMEAREKIAVSYGITLPRPSDDIPANRNPSRHAGNDERRILQNSPAVRDAARHITPVVRDTTRHVTPIHQALEGRGIVTGAGHGLPACSPAPSVPQAHERVHAKSERGLTPALGGFSGTLDEKGPHLKSDRWTPGTSMRSPSASRRHPAHSTTTSGKNAWSPKVEASIKEEEEEERVVSGLLSMLDSNGDSVDGASQFTSPPPFYEEDSGPPSVPSSSMPPSSVSSLSASTSASHGPSTASCRSVYYVSNRTGFVFSSRASASIDAGPMGFRVYSHVPDLIREASQKLSAGGVATSCWFTSNSSKAVFPTIDYALDDAGVDGVAVLDGTDVDVARYLKR